MRISRLLAGVALGLFLLVGLWYGGWLLPPEGLSRRLAAFHASFPGATGEARVSRIECPPLRRLRLYVVCTHDCEGIWRLVLVKGLRARTLADLGRKPPDSTSIARQRMNSAVGREAMRLDSGGAREMIACYLRLDGLRPELVLPEGGLEAVAEARQEGEDAMQRLAERLDEPDAARRIPVAEGPQGFEADLLYWDTWHAGHPVLRLRIGLARDGQLRRWRAWQLPAAPGESPPSVGAAGE